MQLTWSISGSCPAQLSDPAKQDHFSTQDHIHSHLSSGIFIILIFFLHTEINQSRNPGFRNTTHPTERTAKEIFFYIYIEQNGNKQEQLHQL